MLDSKVIKNINVFNKHEYIESEYAIQQTSPSICKYLHWTSHGMHTIIYVLGITATSSMLKTAAPIDLHQVETDSNEKTNKMHCMLHSDKYWRGKMGRQNFSVQGQIVNILEVYGPDSFCHDYFTLPLWHESKATIADMKVIKRGCALK